MPPAVSLRHDAPPSYERIREGGIREGGSREDRNLVQFAGVLKMTQENTVNLHFVLCIRGTDRCVGC